MIPLFIPFVNRPDLLDLAVASAHLEGVELYIINNSGDYTHNWREGAITLVPPVPLNFAQSQNWMLKIATELNQPFYFFMHADVSCPPRKISDLIDMAQRLTEEKIRWGVVFTMYDALCAYNTEAMNAIGGWDTNIPWYYSDDDVYRRIRFGGYPTFEAGGEEIIHQHSSTINADPKRLFVHHLSFPLAGLMYAAKWGNEPKKEIFAFPYNKPEFGLKP